MRLDRLEIQGDILKGFDPRARIVSAFALILTAVGVSHLLALSCVAALCLLLLCRDFMRVLKRLIPLETFCALLLVQAAAGLMGGRVALTLVLRIHCAALLSMLMIVPLGMGASAQALGMMGVSQKLISILFLSHRYMYLMSDKVVCSVRAMRLRQNPRQKGTLFLWKSYAAVFASALAGGFVKAGAVSMALAKRGFGGEIPRTIIWEWKARDTILVVLCFGGLAVYGAYTIFGHLFFV